MPAPLNFPQTSVAVPKRPAHPADTPLVQHATAIFNGAVPTSPVFTEDWPFAEFDVGADASKFVAGWPCVRMLCGEGEEPKTRPDRFFSAANPSDATTRQLFARAYANHSCDGQSVRHEIGREQLAQADREAALLDAVLPQREVLRNQAYRLDAGSGNGLPYLHERDQRFRDRLDKDGAIHTFLPGYATGDRYSLILAALIDPRLKVSVAYTTGNEHERRCALEAAQVVRSALLANHQPDPEKRISVYAFHGPSLKEARESLDSPSTRCFFKLVDGAGSPLGDTVAASMDHVFHISVTTELIARRFRSAPAEELFIDVRRKLDTLVPPARRAEIDGLVEQVIAEQGIAGGSAGLWIADREFANARETEAISRPMMFEQIAAALKARGMAVYCIADTYINRARNERDEETLMDRHPYRPEMHPHIGRFWAADKEGETILAARENQWYFMNRLLDGIGGPVIGIRSGALEPLALMGHRVIYLEHKGMFTPERHACWQNIIPYNRLITHNTTGYRELGTENTYRNLVRRTLDGHLGLKQALPAPAPSIAPDSTGTAALQRLRIIEDDLRKGVLSGHELELLVEMAHEGGTAWNVGRRLWEAP